MAELFDRDAVKVRNVELPPCCTNCRNNDGDARTSHCTKVDLGSDADQICNLWQADCSLYLWRCPACGIRPERENKDWRWIKDLGWIHIHNGEWLPSDSEPIDGGLLTWLN